MPQGANPRSFRTLPEQGKEPGKRDEILAVVDYDRNQRPGVPCCQVGLVEFGYHRTRYIIVPMYPEQLLFKRHQPAVREPVTPSPPGNVEEIVVRVPDTDRPAVERRPLPEVGNIEGLAVEGYDDPVSIEQLVDRRERGELLVDTAEQKLGDLQGIALHPGEPEEDNGTREEPKGLEINEQQVPGGIEAGGQERTMVGR